MKHISSKTFGHDVGLSCCFRQWRATHSHCRFMHGYAISVHLEFEAEKLDAKNWVVDFGDLGEVKDWLRKTFDHRTIVARDDPQKDAFIELERRGLVRLTIINDVGCERFADYIADYVSYWLTTKDNYADRVKLRRVRVSEHGANSAEVEL